MARKFLVPIDLTQLELQNALLHLIAGNPATPVEGQVWYDSTAKKLKFRTNTANVDPTARAEHTGTQTAATVSDFDTQVRTSRLDQMAAPTVPVNLNSQKITSLLAGTADTDGVNLTQVRDMVRQLDRKDAVRVSTTAALPANTRTGNVLTASANGALPAVDGVTLVAGNSLLVANEAAGANNGIYDVTQVGDATNPFILTRRADADVSSEVTAGMTVVMEEGTTHADRRAILVTNNPITLNTTALSFTYEATGETIVGGAGLTKTGSTLDVGAGTGIVVAADSVSVDTATVARKFAVDAAAAASTTCTHNFNTRDVTVAVYRNATPWDEVECDVEHATVNTVIVRFAVAPATAGDYRIVIRG